MPHTHASIIYLFVISFLQSMKKAGVTSPVKAVIQSDVLKALGISTNGNTNGESSTTTCDINGEANSSEQTSGEALVENGTNESVVLPEAEGSQSDIPSNSKKDLELEKNESSKSDVKVDENATEEVKEDDMDKSQGEGSIDNKNSAVTTEKTDDINEPKVKKESRDSSNAEDSDNDDTSNSEACGEYQYSTNI